jgi:hypothetical protein
MCYVLDGDAIMGTIMIACTRGHPAGSYVTRVTNSLHLRAKFIGLINTSGESVAGRFGPDQTAVIEARAGSVDEVVIVFKTPDPPASNYGKLGNMDVLLATAGHQQSIF